MIPQAFAAVGFGALLYALWARLQPAPIAYGYPGDALTGDLEAFEPAPREWLLFSGRPTVGEAARSVPTGWTWPALAEPYRPTIASAAEASGVPTDLLARVLHQESRFRDDIISGRTRSRAGAVGIAQFMPATARQFGIDPTDPNQAIPAAARYLRQLFDRFGDWTLALAAYNWGQGNVARRGLDAAPKETRDYVADITRDVPV